MAAQIKGSVIGIDLGGTKVAAAVVSPAGKLTLERKERTNLGEGWPGLRKQLIELCQSLMRESGKKLPVGIGSAGPLHAPSGTLLDPTNFGWAVRKPVPLARELAKALKTSVQLENDAAAAVLAERWKGRAAKNTVVLTLGTGLGMGVVCDGMLVRGGRGLHPEGGHLSLRPGDATAPCGCGLLGCAEAYLSGGNFEKRAAWLLGEPGLKSAEVEARARAGEPRASALFDKYSEHLADYLQNLVVLYYPEHVILTGSFAAAHELFLPATEKRLRTLLARRLETLPLLPELRVSRLGNKAGILGAAVVARRR